MGYRANISKTTQKKAFDRTGGICIVCGRPLSRNQAKWSVDHFIPRAVYKWVPGRKIQKTIESADNLYIVHPHCNFRKGSALPTNQLISSLHAEEDVKENMRALYKKVEDKVIQYRAIKQSTLDSQHKKCGNCGRRLSLGDAVLRRIDDEQDRVRENAICLCERCNTRICSKKRKQKLAEKHAAKNAEETEKRESSKQQKGPDSHEKKARRP